MKNVPRSSDQKSVFNSTCALITCIPLKNTILERDASGGSFTMKIVQLFKRTQIPTLL